MPALPKMPRCANRSGFNGGLIWILNLIDAEFFQLNRMLHTLLTNFL
jgi:hypothetical protein